MSYAEDRLAWDFLFKYSIRLLSLWVCWGAAVVWTSVLELWPDIRIKFTMNFYINYIPHYYNLIKLRLIYVSSLLSSSFDVLSNRVSSMIFLDLLLHHTCLPHLKGIVHKKGLDVFLMYVGGIILTWYDRPKLFFYLIIDYTQLVLQLWMSIIFVQLKTN